MDKNINTDWDVWVLMPPKSVLSPREEQVLRLVSQGLTNLQIGRTLTLSPHTVKTHLDNILNKLGVSNRTQAAVWAAKHDLV